MRRWRREGVWGYDLNEFCEGDESVVVVCGMRIEVEKVIGWNMNIVEMECVGDDWNDEIL